MSEIALFEGECFGDLKEASLKVAGESGSEFLHE
jgi:hypothetical protein